MATPFNVCGGMQDNYDWCGPSPVRGAQGIANHHWTTIQGGDGFVVLQDPESPRVIYSESQDGNMVRVDRVTGETMSIRPQPPAGEPAYRWHWDTPIILSPHDPKVVYMAAQRVFRSADRGLSCSRRSARTSRATPTATTSSRWGSRAARSRSRRTTASSRGRRSSSLAESPKRAGLLYAGTDDGQAAGDEGRRQDLDERLLEAAERAEGRVRVARSRRRASTRARFTSRSTIIGRTTSRPTSTRATTSARRGRQRTAT